MARLNQFARVRGGRTRFAHHITSPDLEGLLSKAKSVALCHETVKKMTVEKHPGGFRAYVGQGRTEFERIGEIVFERTKTPFSIFARFLAD